MDEHLENARGGSDATWSEASFVHSPLRDSLNGPSTNHYRSAPLAEAQVRKYLRPFAARVNASAAKRTLDLFIAIAATVFLFPALCLIALAIRIDSKGPVFYRQTRYGADGTFSVFKFRTMTAAASAGEFVQAQKHDARVTRLGKILRRTNLDELPQLFNVIKGEMSLVGPRPHPIALDQKFTVELPHLMARYSIKPGITGWAQVNGLRGETATVEKMAARVDHDLWYVERWSIVLDVKILFRTLFDPLSRQNAY